MSASDLAISVQGLSKAYTIAHNVAQHTTMAEVLMHRLRHPFERQQRETFWALKDLSLDIKKGEVLGVIGRNGAGKSTLLKILSRITEPTSGKIDVYGRVGSLLEVGTGFHPELTGRENIYLNGQILGMRKKEIDRQFDAIVDFAEVEKFLDTPVKRYSSGMYVRLAFAVAAHLNPEILVVDEVLAVGDADFQKKCMGRMGQLVGEQGRTILFVSHNMGAIRSLCQRVVWLEQGRIRRVGPTIELSEEYYRAADVGGVAYIDVENLARPRWLSQRLRINSIEINGGKPLLHGEPMKVVIRYEVLSKLNDVSLGIGFSTLDSTRIMSIDSDLTGPRRVLARGSTGRAEFEIDQLHLQPGSYLLDAGGRSGDGNAVDYIPGCGVVEVVPGPRTPSVIVREGGGVRIPANWTWYTSEEQVQSLTVGGGIWERKE